MYKIVTMKARHERLQETARKKSINKTRSVTVSPF